MADFDRLESRDSSMSNVSLLNRVVIELVENRWTRWNNLSREYTESLKVKMINRNES